MTYDEFLDIPVSVLKDLETILLLKSKYKMKITSEEDKICEYMEKFYSEQIKSYEVYIQKQKLEKLFKL